MTTDVYFACGAAASFIFGAGLLLGLCMSETIGFIFYLLSTLSFLGFHFLSRWVDHWRQRRLIEAILKVVRNIPYPLTAR